MSPSRAFLLCRKHIKVSLFSHFRPPQSRYKLNLWYTLYFGCIQYVLLVITALLSMSYPSCKSDRTVSIFKLMLIKKIDKKRKRRSRRSLSLFSQELKVLQKVVQIGEFFFGGNWAVASRSWRGSERFPWENDWDTRFKKYEVAELWKNCFSSWNWLTVIDNSYYSTVLKNPSKSLIL